MSPLSNFLPTGPLALLFDYKSPFALAVFRFKDNLSLIDIVLTPFTKALNKVFLTVLASFGITFSLISLTKILINVSKSSGVKNR